MKIIFAGTTELGISTLEKIKADLIAVITQPDKLAGRKQILTAPPVKLWAEKNNIRVLQPVKIGDAEQLIKDLEPDLMIVASYGQILPKSILDIPKHGSINIHPSLLPKYRGPTPIPAALLNGDKETGTTIIQMDELMDHGPMHERKRIQIEESDNFESLYKKLADLSAETIVTLLPLIEQGKTKAVPQDHTRATFTKLLKHADGKLNWTESAESIHNKIRGYNPEPGTWTTLEGKIVKILKTELLNESRIELPGKLYVTNNNLAVKAGDYSLILLSVQPEGKKAMSGIDYLNGLKNLGNKIFN